MGLEIIAGCVLGFIIVVVIGIKIASGAKAAAPPSQPEPQHRHRHHGEEEQNAPEPEAEVEEDKPMALSQIGFEPEAEELPPQVDEGKFEELMLNNSAAPQEATDDLAALKSAVEEGEDTTTDDGALLKLAGEQEIKEEAKIEEPAGTEEESDEIDEKYLMTYYDDGGTPQEIGEVINKSDIRTKMTSRRLVMPTWKKWKEQHDPTIQKYEADIKMGIELLQKGEKEDFMKQRIADHEVESEDIPIILGEIRRRMKKK